MSLSPVAHLETNSVQQKMIALRLTVPMFKVSPERGCPTHVTQISECEDDCEPDLFEKSQL